MLESFRVFEKKESGWDYENPIWHIYVERKNRRNIEKIIWGIVPSGFIEVGEKKDLVENKIYLVIGESPGGFGSVKFVINKKGHSTVLSLFVKSKNLGQRS